MSASKMQAQDYAGGGKVYSKEVLLEDVAWLYVNEIVALFEFLS